MLYQRYFLRMNQRSTTHTLGLLLALVVSLAAVHIILIPMESPIMSTKAIHRHRYNDSLYDNGTHLTTINRSDSITNTIYNTNGNVHHNFVRLNYNYSTENETGEKQEAFLITETKSRINRTGGRGLSKEEGAPSTPARWRHRPRATG